tara:strand:- start:1389 stop:1556 length:168 start_codon:yes stop_codon:yes gene_type:complete
MSKLKEDFERVRRDALAARYIALKRKERKEMADLLLWHTLPVTLACLLAIALIWS